MPGVGVGCLIITNLNMSPIKSLVSQAYQHTQDHEYHRTPTFLLQWSLEVWLKIFPRKLICTFGQVLCLFLFQLIKTPRN